MKNQLRQLVSKLSYYYAADGEQARREVFAKMEHEVMLREFCQRFTREELEQNWPDEIFLVDKDDFVIWGKE